MACPCCAELAGPQHLQHSGLDGRFSIAEHSLCQGLGTGCTVMGRRGFRDLQEYVLSDVPQLYSVCANHTTWVRGPASCPCRSVIAGVATTRWMSPCSRSRSCTSRSASRSPCCRSTPSCWCRKAWSTSPSTRCVPGLRSRAASPEPAEMEKTSAGPVLRVVEELDPRAQAGFYSYRVSGHNLSEGWGYRGAPRRRQGLGAFGARRRPPRFIQSAAQG